MDKIFNFVYFNKNIYCLVYIIKLKFSNQKCFIKLRGVIKNRTKFYYLEKKVQLLQTILFITF